MADKSPSMKAVIVGSDGVAIQDCPIPTPGEGSALIKVIQAGICNTDLEIMKGYMGFHGILGHEFVGRIIEINHNKDHAGKTNVNVGDRVVGEINLACNKDKCEVCPQGGIAKRNHCPNRQVLGILNKDGVMAEYVTLPLDNLYLVPEGVTDEQATFVEPLAAAYRIVEQIMFQDAHKIAVIGDGKLGLLIIEVMNVQKHNKLCLFGHHQNKLDLAPPFVEKYISDNKTAKKFQNIFDIVVEASGSPLGLMLASEICIQLGIVVLKTTCAAGSNSFNTAPFVVKEITILGSRCGNFPMAIEALNRKQFKVEKLLTEVIKFDEAIKALKYAGTKGTLKIQLRIDNS